MKSVPGYPKILTLGASYTENALVGPVIIQEKIDGSLFGFGVNDDDELVFRSKGATIAKEYPPKMFKDAVDHVCSLDTSLLGRDCYFYCECLEKPKHNVLKYNHIPTNHLVLFDALVEGVWLDKYALELMAEVIGIDIIPELYRGSATVDTIKSLLDTESYLGGETIEGVVVKNYAQTVALGGMFFPLFTKYVRETFKERHNTEWKFNSSKVSIQEWINGFASEARWQKAIQHLEEAGKLSRSPKDIGSLIRIVQEDVKEEEGENIRRYLYNHFIGDIVRKSIVGLPEWYKQKLLESLVEGE